MGKTQHFGNGQNYGCGTISKQQLKMIIMNLTTVTWSEQLGTVAETPGKAVNAQKQFDGIKDRTSLEVQFCIMNRYVCVCFRSWLSYWMKRSWAAFLCWSLPTSRTCWQPPRRLRLRRVSICTPSAIAYGKSRPAPPSLERGFRWACDCFYLFCFYVLFSASSSSHALLLKFPSRRAWIGCARVSTPRKNSFVIFYLSGGAVYKHTRWETLHPPEH